MVAAAGRLAAAEADFTAATGLAQDDAYIEYLQP